MTDEEIAQHIRIKADSTNVRNFTLHRVRDNEYLCAAGSADAARERAVAIIERGRA